MKATHVLLALVVLGGSVLTANAETILEQSLHGGAGDTGGYQGAYWQLSDSGFALSGDSLTQTVALKSVTFMKSGTGGGTGDLTLNVYSGTGGNAGALIGSSTNTVNAAGSSDGTLLTWTFGDLALNKDTSYSYVARTSTNGVTFFDIQLSPNTYPLPTCRLLDISNAVVDAGWAPYLEVTVGVVPEPSTISMLTTGLMGLLAYAWRRRK